MNENDNREPPIGWNEALGEAASNPPTPRGTGHAFTALGQSWTMSSCENRIKAQFESWVQSRARRVIDEMEATSGPEEAANMRDVYMAAYAGGHYFWDGRHCRSARGDLPGLRYLVFLLLRRCHPNITLATAEDIVRDAASAVGDALRWALGNSQPSPRTTTLGGEEDGAEVTQARDGLSGDLSALTSEQLRTMHRLIEELMKNSVDPLQTHTVTSAGTQHSPVAGTRLTMEG